MGIIRSETGQGPRILIVDDSLVMQAMIMRTLAMCGISEGGIRQVEDAESALPLMADGGVDLLLTDLNLPGAGGSDLIDRVSRMPAARGVRIVAIGAESCEARIRSLAERGVLFVHKPFTPERLKEKVEAALEARRHA